MSNYRYAAAGTTFSTRSSHDVVAFESDQEHPIDGFNVLFGDGHVDFIGIGGRDRAMYDHLVADYSAGVRPLRLR